MTKRKLPKKIVIAIVCASVIGSILIACLGLQIAFTVADKIECWHPDYEMRDLTEILEKDTLTDEDYSLLYYQTGLTKTGVDRMLARGNAGKDKLLKLQREFFTEHEVKNDYFAPFICTDFIDDYITNVYLEEGDIIVTSSTHLSGFRIGHAGLVTNGNMGDVLQASAYGSTSAIGDIKDFTDRVNFMILSPKTDRETKNKVASEAAKNLLGKKYDVSAGVLSSKNKASRTQCAHLVWYAYKHYGGIDIDGNGGPVVTPRNIANSPDVELVQVFGFDPDKLWR